MADDGFNGSLLTASGVSITAAVITDLTYDVGGAEVKVSGAGAAKALFEVGVANETCTFTVIGGASGVSRGTKGTSTITWNDGTSSVIGDTVCTNVSISGGEDGAIVSAITLKPSTAAA